MMEQKNKIGNIFVLPWMICRPGHIPYSGKISRTINFTVFEDFTITSKINSSKSHYSIESYDSLVDPRNLIREICRGEITSKVYASKITRCTVYHTCGVEEYWQTENHSPIFYPPIDSD